MIVWKELGRARGGSVGLLAGSRAHGGGSVPPGVFGETQHPGCESGVDSGAWTRMERGRRSHQGNEQQCAGVRGRAPRGARLRGSDAAGKHQESRAPVVVEFQGLTKRPVSEDGAHCVVTTFTNRQRGTGILSSSVRETTSLSCNYEHNR